MFRLRLLRLGACFYHRYGRRGEDQQRETFGADVSNVDTGSCRAFVCVLFVNFAVVTKLASDHQMHQLVSRRTCTVTFDARLHSKLSAEGHSIRFIQSLRS
jgi:hypothetical protein